jgi:fibronectin type 3 domain-containing protein
LAASPEQKALGDVAMTYSRPSCFLYRHLFLLFTLATLFCLNTQGFCASVVVNWEPNTETELAGYKLYWGTASGQYQHSVDVGKNTHYTMENVEQGQSYYFSATAYDQEGLESDLSEECICEVPENYIDTDTITDSSGVNGTISNEETQEAVNIVIEAEEGDIFVPMEIGDDANASTGGYIWPPTGTGDLFSPSPTGGRMDYRFDIPQAGDYVVWGRVMAPDTSSDSFFISLDGSQEVVWHTNRGDQASWTWDVVSVRNLDDVRDASAPHIYHLEAGEHTLTIKQREDGTKLDMVVITNKLDMSPADLE